jgi:hypothetical protein
VVVDPGVDERADRDDVALALRANVVERPAGEPGSDAVALELVEDLGVGEDDRGLREVVLREAGELAVDPGLVAALVRIVGDHDLTHGRQPSPQS